MGDLGRAIAVGTCAPTKNPSFSTLGGVDALGGVTRAPMSGTGGEPDETRAARAVGARLDRRGAASFFRIGLVLGGDFVLAGTAFARESLTFCLSAAISSFLVLSRL